MSFVRRNARRAREATTAAGVRLQNLIRRLAVGASDGGLWQLLGPDDEIEPDVEVFPGIGFASRPADGAGEVILVHVGPNHPVVVATRDESIRVDLAEDETAIFNATSIVKVKADGTIEIGSQGGTFQSLATKADLQTIRNELHEHEHLAPTGCNASGNPTTGGPSVTAPAGTTYLKGE